VRRGTPTVTQVVELSAPAPRGEYYSQGVVQSVNPTEKTLVVDGKQFWTSAKTTFLTGSRTQEIVDLKPGERVGIRAGNKAAAFVVVSILFYITGLLAFLLLPRRGLQQSAHEDDHNKPLRWADLTLAVRLAPSLVMTALIVFIAVGALGGIGRLYARDVFHLSDADYGRMFLVPAIVIGVLTLPLGLLGDWWGTARSVHVGIGVASAAMWAIAAVAILPPLQPIRSAMVLAGLATLIGLGFVMGIPAWLTTVAETAGDRLRAQMIGAVATFEGGGAFLGMLVGPPLFKLGESYPFMVHSPILLAAVTLSIGFVMSLFTIPPRLRQLE
jgi:predicted MFS family arabinose efflux permease